MRVHISDENTTLQKVIKMTITTNDDDGNAGDDDDDDLSTVGSEDNNFQRTTGKQSRHYIMS